MLLWFSTFGKIVLCQGLSVNPSTQTMSVHCQYSLGLFLASKVKSIHESTRFVVMIMEVQT